MIPFDVFFFTSAFDVELENADTPKADTKFGSSVPSSPPSKKTEEKVLFLRTAHKEKKQINDRSARKSAFFSRCVGGFRSKSYPKKIEPNENTSDGSFDASAQSANVRWRRHIIIAIYLPQHARPKSEFCCVPMNYGSSRQSSCS